MSDEQRRLIIASGLIFAILAIVILTRAGS